MDGGKLRNMGDLIACERNKQWQRDAHYRTQHCHHSSDGHRDLHGRITHSNGDDQSGTCSDVDSRSDNSKQNGCGKYRDHYCYIESIVDGLFRSGMGDAVARERNKQWFRDSDYCCQHRYNGTNGHCDFHGWIAYSDRDG